MSDAEHEAHRESEEQSEKTVTQIETPEAITLSFVEDDKPLVGKIQITSVGLKIIGKLGYDEWCRALYFWRLAIHRLHHIGLTDLMNYGKDEFGQAKVDEALEVYHFDMADVLKCYTIGQLPLDLREPALTGEHYYILAKTLPGAPKDQGKWAAIAKKEELNPIELKRSIEQGKVVKQTDIEHVSGQNSGIPNIEGIAMTFQRWLKQAGGEEVVLGQANEWKEHFLEEVEPLRALAEKIEESLPPPEESDEPGGDNVPSQTEPPHD